MDPLYHSKSSVKKWGGEEEDYIHIHHWFDDSKRSFSGPQHRSMRHHTEGIGWCIDRFGKTIVLSTGKEIPVRYIAEQHILEDCGRIPTMKDWLVNMQVTDWMKKVGKTSNQF